MLVQLLPLIVASLSLAVVPATFWFWFYYRQNIVPRRLAALTFLFGMAATLPLIVIDWFLEVDRWLLGVVGQGSLLAVILLSLYVGFTEEYAKHFVVKELDYNRKDFDQVIDGISYSIIAALGFSFVENVRFFVAGGEYYGLISWSFVTLFILRTFGSTLAHCLFSGLYGYYYGKAKFAKCVLSSERRRRRSFAIRKGLKLRYRRFQHFLKIKSFYDEFRDQVEEEAIAAEGLLVAGTLHALFNFFLSIGRAFLTVPFLFLEYMIVAYELSKPENREVFINYPHSCKVAIVKQKAQ